MIYTITHQQFLKAKAKFRKVFKCKTDRSSACNVAVAKFMFLYSHGILNVEYKNGSILEINF